MAVPAHFLNMKLFLLWCIRRADVFIYQTHYSLFPLSDCKALKVVINYSVLMLIVYCACQLSPSLVHVHLYQTNMDEKGAITQCCLRIQMKYYDKYVKEILNIWSL
jgi:hypothetical protein